ncbi:hypothetical protein LPJ55_004053 [Coemansia sp. RSA 990]|nr:hypothetical protein LPJ68_004151 [Coemansia sp. RSA 1086]KAJ1871220.1 hypothetical protein LPJ55_004053 [Coemansia sp. RSA 990]
MLNTLFDHLSIEQGPWTNVRVLKVVSDKDDGSLLYTHPIDRDEQQPEPADDTIEQQPEPTNAAIEQQNVFQIASAAAKIAAHLPNHLSKYKDPVDSVVVSTCAPAGDASAFYSATSQLFGGKSCAIFTSLTLCSSPEMLDFNRINWIQLNKLSIFTRVPAVVLIDLISRLPSLNDLALSAVTMEGWDHQKESEVDNENCEPISTTITKVYYNDIFMSGDSSTPEFLKYLLLAIPNIAEFAFSNEYFHEMLKFVQALGHKSHPHLFQIRYDILC